MSLRSQPSRLFLLAGWCAFVTLISAQHSEAEDISPRSDMVRIPAGEYIPLYKDISADPIPVPAFLLDRHAVTNAAFLEFVRDNPQWRRSRVNPLFADAGYLSHWKGDLDPGLEDERIARAPVTRVSWFAARAYARWKNKRLPTIDEWERAGSAFTAAEGRPEYNQVILKWYSVPTPDIPDPIGSTFPNLHGAYDLHGLIWEWVEDFNSSLVTGESREDGSLDRRRFCGSGALNATDSRNYAAFMRYAFRSSLEGNHTVANLGFRCAADLSPDTADPDSVASPATSTSTTAPTTQP